MSLRVLVSASYKVQELNLKERWHLRKNKVCLHAAFIRLMAAYPQPVNKTHLFQDYSLSRLLFQLSIQIQLSLMPIRSVLMSLSSFSNAMRFQNSEKNV